MAVTATEPSALRSLRERRGLTAAELARRAGVSVASLRAWEAGHRSPSAGALLRLAEALAVDPREILPTPSWRLGRLSEEMSDDPAETWSPSKLSDWLRCPAFFKFRHIDRLPTVPNTVETAIGRAVHKAAEAALLALAPDAAPEGAAAPEKPEAAIASEIALAVTEGVEPDEDGGEPDPAAMRDEAKALHALWQAEIAPKLGKPVAVEQRVEVEIAGVRLTVIPDMITDDGWVRDLKTTRRKPSQADVDENLQATAESLAYRELLGEAEEGVAFDFIVRTRKPYAMTLETTRGPRDHDRLARIVAAAAESVASGRYWPNPANRFGCASCPYRDVCRETF
ncbi:MAG: PD-(D/E)XK nuclease family protein [Bacillota bacterium]|nr:PD-(D/E)XK nuclease family protein [Bacillota bacterium]